MKTLRIAPKLSLPVDVAGEAIAILAKRGAGKTNTATVLVEEMHAAGVQVVILDPVGAWWGIRSSADGKSAGLPFAILGGEHGDVPLEHTAGAVVADVVVDTGQSLLLDLSDFSSKAQMARFVVDFGERLFRRKGREKSLLHLVLEEADSFAPQKGSSDDARMRGAIEQIVRRGRSRGLGLTMVTQRSAVLNKDVLSQADVLIAMRTTSPHDTAAVKLWITAHDDDEHGVIASLPSLQDGEAWIWNPERDVLDRVKVRLRSTFDSARTPKAGEKRAEPKKAAAIDLNKLGAEIQATAERAKENDPAELRKQIRELQRQLAAAPAGEPEQIVETVVERVEVPALGKGELDRLEQSWSEMRELGHHLLDRIAEVQRAVEVAGVIPTNATPRAERAERRETARRAGPGSSVAPARPPSPPAAPRDPSEGLTGPEQRVLDALAWYEALGIRTPTKLQVGFVAGYRVSKKVGGTYGNILGTLRSQGLIEYPSNGAVALTAGGRDLSRDPGIGYGNDAMQNAVLARLDGPERRVLENLIRIHPSEISKQELGELSGYTVTEKIGGTYGNILGRLRSLGLIDYPGPGLAVATDVLFPEDS